MVKLHNLFRPKKDRIGNYHLERKIATGGMSEIYKAKRSSDDEIVALKVLTPESARFAQMLEKAFQSLTEGEIAKGLNHPNVIRTYEYGRERHRYYIVMEYVNGINLKYLVECRSPLVEGRKMALIIQIAQGLNYIHKRGLIHRDICPKNVLVNRKGEAKIIDFGLTILKSGRFKGRGDRAGTPSYMAPEQVRADRVDEKTDIYSFGVTMYEILTRKTPFRGEDAFSRMQRHLAFNPLPPRKHNPDISPELEKIILKSMEKDPAKRYPTMQVVLDNLPLLSKEF